MTKTQFTLEVVYHDSSDKVHIEVYDTLEERDAQYQRLIKEARTEKNISRLNVREAQIEIKATATMEDLAIIAVIIGHEFHNPVLTRTMLSHAEVDRKLLDVALSCHNAFRNFPIEGEVSSARLREEIIKFSKAELLDKHHIKV